MTKQSALDALDDLLAEMSALGAESIPEADIIRKALSGPDHKSAFPLHPGILPDWDEKNGMSLHDWYVGMALQGLIASETFTNCGPGFEDFIAIKAINVADAIMKNRV